MVKKYERMFTLTIHQNTVNTSPQTGENEKGHKYLMLVWVQGSRHPYAILRNIQRCNISRKHTDIMLRISLNNSRTLSYQFYLQECSLEKKLDKCLKLPYSQWMLYQSGFSRETEAMHTQVIYGVGVAGKSEICRVVQDDNSGKS